MGEISNKIKSKKPKKGFLDGYKTYDTSNGFGTPESWKEAFEQRMNYKTLTIEEKEENKGIVQSLYEAKTAQELKLAYRELMKKYHPDIAGDTDENKTISQLLNDTYFDLKNKF